MPRTNENAHHSATKTKLGYLQSPKEGQIKALESRRASCNKEKITPDTQPSQHYKSLL